MLFLRELQLKNKIIRRPVGLCWLLGSTVAIPMWLDLDNHYRDEEDLSKCICRFPYQYVSWRSLKTSQLSQPTCTQGT